MREFDKLIVGSKEEYERMQANRKNVLDFVQENVHRLSLTDITSMKELR